MIVSAQISVYPLRRQHIGPVVGTVAAVLAGQGLEPQIGPMSTMIIGEHEKVFAALGKAFAQAAEDGELVMSATISNACPVAR
jgi:uncharacterized protein YqgV (UPF0045/DUF77 family)